MSSEQESNATIETRRSTEMQDQKERKEERERGKTKEEMRKENIERLTAEARIFIDGRKEKLKKEQIRKELAEKQAEEEMSQEEEDMPVEAEAAKKKKKGILDRISDKFLLRKLRKAGIENTQKALELYEYIRKIDSDFTLDSGYHLDIIKNSFEATDNPISFYEKLREVANVERYINPNAKEDNSGHLMTDPKFMEKIDLFKLVMETFGKGRKRAYVHEVANFCQDEKTLARLSPENLDRVKKLLVLSGDKENVNKLSSILDVVEDEEVYGVVLEIAKGRRENDIVHVTYMAEKVRALRENDMLKKILAGTDLNLNVSSAVTEIMYDEKKRAELENLEIEKLKSDEEFKQLSNDFLVLSGKGFSLDEMARLKKLQDDTGQEWLAFFEALRKIGQIKENDQGNFGISEICGKIENWKKLAGSSAFRDERDKQIYAVCDSRFQALAAEVKNLKGELKDDDIKYLIWAYSENPGFVDKLTSPEGKELIDFLNERGVPILNSRYLFEIPGLINTLKKFDRYVHIGGNYAWYDIINFHKSGQGQEAILEYLEGCDLEDGKKFTAPEIFPLYKLMDENSGRVDEEVLKKYFSFFFNGDVQYILANYPAKANELNALAEDGFLEKRGLYAFYQNNLDKILSIPREKRKTYIDLLEKIDNSPSQELQRIKNEIIGQLLGNDNPEAAYRKIEDIFIKNNLPLVGKAFKIFAVLHPADDLERTLSQGNLSPYLTEAKTRRRYFTIYRDLINIHIKSGNWSLRDYLIIFQENEDLFGKIDDEGFESLNPQERKRAELVLKKVKTLFENTQKGRNMRSEEMRLEGNLEENYDNLKMELGVGRDQKVIDRISQMFLQPAGLENIGQALEMMREAKKTAHERGLNLASGGPLEIKEGDLLKGVDNRFISNILQNGSVSKEFLGASSDKDSTPLDTDLSFVLKEDAEKGFGGAIDASMATGYGSLLFCLKNRGQYQDTTGKNLEGYDPSRLELFQTLGGRHYGIRTGFPTTEIDFMITKDDLRNNPKNIEGLYLEIAQNGFYIPIADTSGNIIFTPEMYEEYRKAFDGLDRFEGSAVNFVPTRADDKDYEDIAQMTRELPRDRESVKEISSKIRSAINKVLERNGVELKDEFDTSIIGAELMDTGSTARHTNAPNNYDFDLILRLDNFDMEKVPQIVRELNEVFQAQEDRSNEDKEGGYQLRAMGATGIDGNPMDIDVGFVKKSELVQYGSHDAVSDKLNWIKDHIGQEAYEQTIANIILAKKILKEGEAYKKFEHGGIGGIGVENWILANGGNVEKAFQTFFEAAHNENGEVVTLEEFRKKYRIIDPGINMKFNSHDNFIGILKEAGYQAMVKVIGDYLGK